MHTSLDKAENMFVSPEGFQPISSHLGSDQASFLKTERRAGVHFHRMCGGAEVLCIFKIKFETDVFLFAT